MKLLASWTIAIFVVVVSEGAACASDADLVLGVNRMHLSTMTQAKWKEEIDSMEAAGVHYLRTDVTPPTERIPEIVSYANAHGIEVLLAVPTWLPIFYDPGTKPRPRQGIFPEVLPLSKIDLDKFSEFWRLHRDQMQTAGAHAFAYELGNEINGPGFNGDFPLNTSGGFLDLEHCLDDACRQVEQGWEKYVEMLKIMRSEGNLGDSRLVAAGMVPNHGSAQFAKSSGIFMISGKDAIKRLIELGAAQSVDAFAMHIYPSLGAGSEELAQGKLQFGLKAVLDDCTGGMKDARSECWITEWGIPSKASGCEPDEKRAASISSMVSLLRSAAKEQELRAAYYFDWDANPTLSIYRCGKMLSNPLQ